MPDPRRLSESGALSTLAADPEGYPYGSVASYGLDDRGNPLFFVSLMAEHTQNAMRDPRASLLVTEPVPDGADPLASGRVTLLGLMSTVAEDDRPTARDRYLEANPQRRTTSTSVTSSSTASTCRASAMWVATGG